MENALDIIGKSPADLAEIMGMSNAPAKSTSALAEIKQVHQNVMGTKEVDGEAMEVAIVKAGAFSVTFPDDFQTEEEKIYRLDSEFKWVGQIDGVTRVWGSFSNGVFDE